MNTVYSLDEARNWFLRNDRGMLICVNGSNQVQVASYPQAEAFYNSPQPEPEQVSRQSSDDYTSNPILGIATVLSTIESFSDPSPSTPDTSSSFDGGGGDFGGGGGGSDW